MSDPIVTGCGLPIFDIETCQNRQTIFYSAQQTATCTSSGPYVSPAGKFTSLVSQADADAQATAYLSTVTAGACAYLQIIVAAATLAGGTPANFLKLAIDGGAIFTPSIGQIYKAFKSLVVSGDTSQTINLDQGGSGSLNQAIAFTAKNGIVNVLTGSKTQSTMSGWATDSFGAVNMFTTENLSLQPYEFSASRSTAPVTGTSGSAVANIAIPNNELNTLNWNAVLGTNFGGGGTFPFRLQTSSIFNLV